jgi:LSD1 subclass zinc finger protein
LPVIWFRNSDEHWHTCTLDASSRDIRPLRARGTLDRLAGSLESGLANNLLALCAANAERWLVMAGPDAQLRVNGIPLGAVGARVLCDRDELSIPGVGSAYYSAESLAEIVAFPGADRVVLCGRCRQPIHAGSSAVRCTGCGTWYHERSDLNCFSYSETCTFCPKATVLDAGFSWTPEE